MFARNLLVAMVNAYPPDAERHHLLGINEFGQFQLVLAINGGFQPIIFDDKDFHLGLDDLIDEITRAINSTPALK